MDCSTPGPSTNKTESKTERSLVKILKRSPGRELWVLLRALPARVTSVYRLSEDQTFQLRFMEASFHQAEKSSVRESYLEFLAPADIHFMSASP